VCSSDLQTSGQPAKSRHPKEGPKRTRSTHQKRVQGKAQKGEPRTGGRRAGNLGSKKQNLRRGDRHQGTGKQAADIGDERGPRGGSGGGQGNRQNRAVNRQVGRRP